MKRAEAEHAAEVLAKINVDVATLIRYLDRDFYSGYLVAMGHIAVALIQQISEEEIED